MIRRYSDLQSLGTFKERYDYLALRGVVGDSTFGFDRYMNQQFYRSREWKSVRNQIIVRDMACDLGVEGYDIHETIYVHHMNPMSVDDIKHGDDSILDPQFLICTTHKTHNAIHYGDERMLPRPVVERKPGDTKLW